MWVVYKIVFPSGKVFVGRTDDLEHRKLVHAKSIDKVGSLVRSAGGIDGVEWVVLQECRTAEAAKGVETKYILSLKANDPKYGYNPTRGGHYDDVDRQKKRDKKGDREVEFSYKQYLKTRYGIDLDGRKKAR